jgi:hypothetical protein
MKNKIVFVSFFLFTALAVSAQSPNKAVESIRKAYADAAEKARLAETDDEHGEIGELVMNELTVNSRNHQWRAVGIYGQAFKFFYKGGNSEAHLYPDELVMVKAERSVSNRKYKEEYLFDGNGRLIFYFQRAENDEMVPAERRIYFDAGRAVRVIEDGKTRDKLSAADLRSAREVQAAAVKLRDVFLRTINL